MSQDPASLRRTAVAGVYAVIAAGAAVLAYATWDLVRHPFEPSWLLLAGLTVGTGLVMLKVPAVQIGFSISDTFNIAAALLFGPSAGAITAALDALVVSSQFRFSRRTAYRLPFNIAVSAIAIWLAARSLFLLAGDRPLLDGPWAAVRLIVLLAIFAAVNYLVNTGLVAMAISSERHLAAFTVWREHFVGLWVTHFGGVLAVVPLLLLQRLQASIGAMEVLVLLVPLPAILYTTFRHAVGRVQDHVSHLGQVNRVYVAVIEALAHAIDAKDQVTHDHIRRVQTQAIRLARALGVQDEDQLQAIMAAALLHDVGKLAVPEHILNKPGKLTPAEFEVMKRHAPAGADILSVVGFPYPVVPIVRHHHENWDGSGYPDGIAGEQIPIGARVLAVVDCFDALTSHRPYRPRMEEAAALQIIIERRGIMYDPRVVDVFLDVHDAPAPDSAALPVAVDIAPENAPPPSRSDDRDLLDLQAFCELGQALASATRPVQVGETLWAHMRARIPASTFVLYAHDPVSDTLVAVHQDGDDADGFRWMRIPTGQRLSGWVAATREPIVNSDARLDLDESVRERSTLQSALAVPVETETRVIGVLSFYSPAASAFDDRHRRIAQAAAYAIARIGLSFHAVPRGPDPRARRLETVQ